MISNWKVVKHVASRYGGLESIFDDAERKLQLVKDGQIPLISLEENTDRLQKRIAREHQPIGIALERINGIANFQDKYVLDKLSCMARSVCRLLKKGNPIGTGFLIADGIIITNHHVIEEPKDGLDMHAEFDYELDMDQLPKTSSCFKLQPDSLFMTSSLDEVKDVPNSGLDFTIVAISKTGTKGESLANYEPVYLDGNLGKIIKGESCVIIQHPSGQPKKIVLKDTAFFSETGSRLVYESDTLPGSSGSMVVALGTCEIIALHHSGLPRTDDQNRPLTRSGELATASTPDDEIDWIGNEGIKVSRIIKAIREEKLPASMESYRDLVLKKTEKVEAQLSQDVSTKNITMPTEVTPIADEKPASKETPSRRSRGQLSYFEVLLSDSRIFRDDWELKARTLVPGLLTRRPMISESTDPIGERLEYICVDSSQDPWQLAQTIENLPHVESCTPDLEVYTDVGIAEESLAQRKGLESAVVSDGTATLNEETFLKDWSTSKWYLEAQKLKSQLPNYFRQWNWLAVNCPPDSKRTSKLWQEVQKNLSSLRFVQLDTGYTQHSKCYSGYDLTRDFDFIEQDQDAIDVIKDIRDRLLLKHPSHGTRTASLTVGNKLTADSLGIDGNSGLLTFMGTNPVKLIPYRVSKSVILIGRAEEVVNAASYAIQNTTDVMFMCMGSYPRTALEVIARQAYNSGVIWVCAAGNEVELVVAPAMYPGTIAVAAVNPNDLPWKGSSNGPMVDIAAPGESVYVPYVDKDTNEIMVYGDGTSYATPHVASAAVLWKARHLGKLKELYPEPWMVVEAFRSCLRASARKPDNWPERYYSKYGAGILDIEELLKTPLPDPHDLVHAYAGSSDIDRKDLGVREAAHYLWNVIKRKLKGGPLESFNASAELTPRGKAALQAFSVAAKVRPQESVQDVNKFESDQLLRSFFNQ